MKNTIEKLNLSMRAKFLCSNFCCLVVFVAFFYSGCKKDHIITLQQATYEKMPYKHDKQFAYFKGIDNYKDYRKKIEYTFKGSPIAVYQYANPKMDTLHGAWVTFHANGNISGSGYYINGIKVGSWKTYFDAKYKNKPFLKSEEYYVNDQLNGPMKVYHENTKLFASYNYVNGLKHQTVQKWFDDGTPLYQAKYNMGKLLEQTEWFPNGYKKIHQQYENDKIWLNQNWDTNGVLRSEVKMREDKYIQVLFDEDGIEIENNEIEINE